MKWELVESDPQPEMEEREAPAAGKPASNPAADLPRTMLPAGDDDSRGPFRDKKFLSRAERIERARRRPAESPIYEEESAATAAQFDRVKFLPPRLLVRKPGQRRADHGARRFAAEWRAYQAAWQKPINELECDKERFFYVRRYCLNLNRKQVARVLRVSVNTVLNWEHGTHPVPFPALLALILISESQHYRLANEAWRDWEFGQKFSAEGLVKGRGYITYLCNRATGAYFEPKDLNNLHTTMQRIGFLNSKNSELQRRLDALTGENTELRKLFLADGITGDLCEMRDKLQTLFERINTATVLPLPSKKAVGE